MADPCFYKATVEETPTETTAEAALSETDAVEPPLTETEAEDALSETTVIEVPSENDAEDLCDE